MRYPTKTTARLRGAFVGSASGAVSIAAHALGGGTVAPDQATLALLLAACTLVGFLVTAVRSRHGAAEVMAMLGIGQAIGHMALSLGHHHSGGMTAVMLVAHLIAIPVGALLIHGAEIAAARAASSVRRAVVALETLPYLSLSPVVAVPAGSAATPRRLLLSSGIGTRGPPARN